MKENLRAFLRKSCDHESSWMFMTAKGIAAFIALTLNFTNYMGIT
jgi:hypothetical protein